MPPSRLHMEVSPSAAMDACLCTSPVLGQPIVEYFRAGAVRLVLGLRLCFDRFEVATVALLYHNQQGGGCAVARALQLLHAGHINQRDSSTHRVFLLRTLSAWCDQELTQPLPAVQLSACRTEEQVKACIKKLRDQGALCVLASSATPVDIPPAPWPAPCGRRAHQGPQQGAQRAHNGLPASQHPPPPPTPLQPDVEDAPSQV